MGNANGTTSKVVRVFNPEDVPPEVIERLVALFGAARLEQLAELTEGVIRDTHWGDVRIVIAEGRVQYLKSTKS